MIKNVLFMNQASAENNVGMENWAMISITDLDDARIKEGWHSMHGSKFCDVDTVMSDKDYEPEMLMTLQEAIEIVDYVHAVAPEVDGIVVHCHGGVSRSAAVAKWIATTYHLPFNEKYQLFNKLVFDQMIKATEVQKNKRNGVTK